jgi:hypothetical protein
VGWLRRINFTTIATILFGGLTGVLLTWWLDQKVTTVGYSITSSSVSSTDSTVRSLVPDLRLSIGACGASNRSIAEGRTASATHS